MGIIEIEIRLADAEEQIVSQTFIGRARTCDEASSAAVAFVANKSSATASSTSRLVICGRFKFVESFACRPGNQVPCRKLDSRFGLRHYLTILDDAHRRVRAGVAAQIEVSISRAIRINAWFESGRDRHVLVSEVGEKSYIWAGEKRSNAAMRAWNAGRIKQDKLRLEQVACRICTNRVRLLRNSFPHQRTSRAANNNNLWRQMGGGLAKSRNYCIIPIGPTKAWEKE